MLELGKWLREHWVKNLYVDYHDFNLIYGRVSESLRAQDFEGGYIKFPVANREVFIRPKNDLLPEPEGKLVVEGRLFET